VKKLLKGVVEEDILPITEMSDSDKEMLGKQAKLVKDLEVWKRIKSQMQEEAKKRMFERSKNFDDMIFGKACLYIIDVIEQKLENLSKL
jgi:hypothetical protein